MAISANGLLKLYLLDIIFFEDYVLLKNNKKQKMKRHKNRLFCLDNYSNEQCEQLFRFWKHDIYRLTYSLQIPAKIRLKNRIKFTGTEGLCILLRRLSYPSRYRDLQSLFDRSISALSRIFNLMVNFVFVNFKYLMYKLDKPWLTEEQVLHFQNVLTEAGCPFKNAVGFIDGTTRPICRPKKNQSGYKKVHVLKYQSILLPNGIIGRLDGPIIGRRHDAAILHISKLLDELTEKFTLTNRQKLCLIGDSGYSNQTFIKVPYKANQINSQNQQLVQSQHQFNKDLSSVRVSVEHGFAKIQQYFAFTDFKKNQKLFLQTVKQQYIVSAILTNCHTCMYGSQISEYFHCSPPCLEIYLNKRN